MDPTAQTSDSIEQAKEENSDEIKIESKKKTDTNSTETNIAEKETKYHLLEILETENLLKKDVNKW